MLNGIQCIHGEECKDGSLVCIFEVERMGAGALTRLSTQPCGAPLLRNKVCTSEQSKEVLQHLDDLMVFSCFKGEAEMN